jgi:proteasome lid subunit RPN8/RPN11
MELKEMFYISEDNWYKLQAWAKLAYDEDKNEISGLMTAIPQKDGRYELRDIEILTQENTGSNTELEADAVTEYKMKYAMKHKNKDMKYVWWHSHHTMGAFWSGTDEKEIDAWENESFSLALVINLKEEYVFRVSLWKANGLPIKEHYDTELTIEREVQKIEITKEMRKQYEELCDNKVHQTTVWSGYRKPNNMQRSMFVRNEHCLDYEKAYSELMDKLDNLIDAFTDGSIGMKEYRKAVKNLNTNCKKHKLPFKVVDIKGNKQHLINELMTMLAGDMIEWTDLTYKESIEETHVYNGGWIYGH